MTLHWWMHWFWVTTQVIGILTIPVPSTTEEPRFASSTGEYHLSILKTVATPSSVASRGSFRIAKAIGVYPSIEESSPSTEATDGIENSTAITVATSSSVAFAKNETTPARYDAERVAKNPKKDSKITWILSNKTRKYDERNSTQDSPQDLAVLSLQENKTRLQNKTRSSLRKFNRSEVDDSVAEPQVLATVSAIGIGESTRLSRARSAFTGDFQSRDQVQEDNASSEYNESSSGNEVERAGNSAVDIAAITGSCVATIVLLSTMGSLGFIVYRRRYLNPPQTLNSDKCSNPDSSGYIDDSTIRDNSEEMYSLDNDSFLNSLEAMTIQNYWTDSVKHTKL